MSESTSAVISEADYEAVKCLLGRSPRGLQAISVRDTTGSPVVIQVSPLVDKKPFPTLFWLVDKRLNYAIDQLEARGVIAQFQERIDESEALQESMNGDHRAYIALRDQLMSSEQKAEVEKLGYTTVFQRRGIGGIENFSRIRCLHTYYAAHLVVANTVGALVDDYWQGENKHFDHLS